LPELSFAPIRQGCRESALDDLIITENVMGGVGVDVSKPILDVAWSSGKERAFANSLTGWKALARGLSKDDRIVLEATGGYEQGVLDYLTQAGFWVCRVNARQARDFAKGLGLLAKTDRLDARMLAQMACVVGTLNRYVPPPPAQREIGQWITRRQQVVETLHRVRQRLAMLEDAQLRRWAQQELLAATRQLRRIEQGLRERLQALPVRSAFAHVKGAGVVLTTTLIGLVPELGRLSRRAIAKLIGVAPLNDDSGTRHGRRSVWGGRALVRAVLYMATLTAVRHEPPLRTMYQRLRANGKAKKVALVACMRKFLVILNARVREHYEQNPPAPAL
jgi:transposase